MPRPATRADVLDAVARLPRDRTRYVGIDGFGGAGKSCLAAWLAAEVPRAVVVPVDDFAGPQIPEWDWARLQRQVLDPLREGRHAHYQRWDWDSDRGAEWHDVPPGRMLLIEGVSATRRELDVAWDLTVWVETPKDVRRARALERDGPELMSRWLEDWIPAELAYVAREHPQDRVDFVVRGDELD